MKNWLFNNKSASPLSKFKVGDLVEPVVGVFDPPTFECYRFEPCEIIRQSTDGKHDWHCQFADGVVLEAQELCLRKLPPPNEITVWDKCAWKPTELKDIARS